MRKYKDETVKEIIEIRCNKCGKEIAVKEGIIREGVLGVETFWGYFSKKDGERHSFDLCEECYDELAEKFQIPVQIEIENELL